jgi:hypothetical protein
MQTSLPVSFFSTGGQQRIFVRTLFSDKSFCSKIFSLSFIAQKVKKGDFTVIENWSSTALFDDRPPVRARTYPRPNNV